MFIFLLHFSYQRLLFRIKSKPDVTLRSSKHEEITFPREFISVPTRASLGQYRQKNVKSGRFGKEIFFKKKRGVGVQTFCTLRGCSKMIFLEWKQKCINTYLHTKYRFLRLFPWQYFVIFTAAEGTIFHFQYFSTLSSLFR